MSPTEEDAAIQRTTEDFELRGITVPQLGADRGPGRVAAGVLVAAEYASSGIWGIDPDDPDGPSPGASREALGFPEELNRALDAWIEWYCGYCERPESFDLEGFNSRGRQLALEVKRFLGAEIRVFYAPESDSEEPSELEEVDGAG